MFTKEAGGWSQTAKQQGILFDLSRVEWVDVGALVQLVLLVETALRNGIRVDVALPLTRARQSEERWVKTTSIPWAAESIKQHIEKRIAAKNFLTYLRFEYALRAKHLSDALDNLSIIDTYNPSDDSMGIEEEEESSPKKNVTLREKSYRQDTYKYFFPLTWLSGHEATPKRDIVTFFADVVGDLSRGLEGVDANTIANVVLYELVDNVTQHAKDTRWALIAAWARPSSAFQYTDDYLDVEHPYIEWLSQVQVPMVEIFFGDSGQGIPAALTDTYRKEKDRGKVVPCDSPNEISNVLVWAFDRWSSSKASDYTRGTRGLYRIDRIVRKYHGLVTVRSSDQAVGLDHGGPAYDKSDFNPKRLSTVPGTFLRLRIPSLHENLPVWRDPPKLSDPIRFDIVKLGALVDDGIDPSDMARLHGRLSSSIDTQPQCIIAVINQGVAARESVERAVKQATEIRHPAALVLYGLPGGWSSIDNAIDSVNQIHEEQCLHSECHPENHFEVWDPVLVIGEYAETAWAGATQACRQLLSALLTSKDGSLSNEEIVKLIPDTDERISVLRELRNDTNLIKFCDDKSLEIRFTLSSIVREIIKDEIDGSPSQAGLVFRTPSLILINKRIKVQSIVEITCGIDLTMLALAMCIKQHECWISSRHVDLILGDSTVSEASLKSLQNHLRASRCLKDPSETGAPVPAGERVIRPDSNVVIHCGIMLSGETARRCAGHVLWNDAKPIAVTCVVDARKDPNQAIEIWGTHVPVIALVTTDIIVNPETYEGDIIDISPINGDPETHEMSEGPDGGFRYEIDRKHLNDLIIKENALHFSHIGQPIGRHFTFYLDASPLIREAAIGEAFLSEINNSTFAVNGA